MVVLTHVVQVKVPVSDLAASVAWYRRLFQLELVAEFVEDGTLRGASLASPSGRFRISLRERDVCASKPVLTGFDPFSIAVESEEALRELAARCVKLALAHGEIQDRGEFGAALDIPDPDGTVLRFLWEPIEFRGQFFGFEFSDGPPRIYDKPRLRD